MVQGPQEDVAPTIHERGEGTVHPGLSTHTLKADSAATRGAYSLYEEAFPPGHPGPAIHIHHEQEEAFYVVEGELTFLLGEQLITATTGTFVLVPAGWRHGFANRSDRVARVVNIHSPGGFEDVFERMGQRALGSLDAETYAAYAAQRHIEYVGRPLGAA